MNKYRLEEYKEEYFNILYEMKKDNFKWYVEKLYGWDEEKQINFLKDFIEEHRNHIRVIKLGNEIIGIFTNYIDENNESVISLFYIDKKYQGQGIGTDILNKQLEVDRKNNRNTILQVFKENPARFLYQKVGFKIYEETASHFKMRKLVRES
ncbi:MAG TPA: GNAT family N-acetyltransferase [Clostridiaceae bacterium]|nr:GNAT family N-acetyltransferase [Clostridiaceae bacterium]